MAKLCFGVVWFNSQRAQWLNANATAWQLPGPGKVFCIFSAAGEPNDLEGTSIRHLINNLMSPERFGVEVHLEGSEEDGASEAPYITPILKKDPNDPPGFHLVKANFPQLTEEYRKRLARYGWGFEDRGRYFFLTPPQ